MGPTGHDRIKDNIISTIKGAPPTSLPGALDVSVLPKNANSYLVFLQNKNGQVSPIQGNSFAIGFSGKPDQIVGEFANGGVSTTLSKLLSGETSPECIWQQSYLLCQSTNQEDLKTCLDALSKQTSSSPPLSLAKALLGVRLKGISALQEIKEPVSILPSDKPSLLEFQCLAMLSSWIQNNTKADNYNVVLKFAEKQRGMLRGDALSGISRYVNYRDMPSLLDMFSTDTDPLVQYGCIQGLGKIYEMTSAIPTYDSFLKNKEAIMSEWKKRVLTLPPQ